MPETSGFAEVTSQISAGAGDLVDLLWSIAPIMIPVVVAVVAIRFIPKLLKSFGR